MLESQIVDAMLESKEMDSIPVVGEREVRVSVP